MEGGRERESEGDDDDDDDDDGGGGDDGGDDDDDVLFRNNINKSGQRLFSNLFLMTRKLTNKTKTAQYNNVGLYKTTKAERNTVL